MYNLWIYWLSSVAFILENERWTTEMNYITEM